MSKTPKTYRLSDAALEAIEQRDKTKYKTEIAFIEAKILQEEPLSTDPNLLRMMIVIQKDLELIKNLLLKEEDFIPKI